MENSLRNKILSNLFGLLFLLGSTGLFAQSSIPIYNEPLVTPIAPSDQIPFSKSIGGGNFQVKNITVQNLSAAVGSNVAPQFVGQTNSYSTNQSVVGASITSSALYHTNVLNPAPFTASYTNGNNWLAINGTSGNFQKILLYSFIRNGSEEYLVVGITNANQTVAIWPNAASSQTAVAVTLGNPSLPTYDNLPRQVGALFDGGGYGVTGYSIGNKGVQAFGEGADTTIIQMISDTAKYYSISVGVGKGGGHQNQFQIQSGSLFGDLVVLSNDDIAMRGGLTNNQGPNVLSRQPILAPQILATNFTATINPAGILSGLTCVGTNQNDYVLASGTLSPQIQLHDTLTISGQGNFMVTGITNAGNVIALYPVLSGTFTTGAAITVQKPLFLCTNTTLGIVAGINAAGCFVFSGTSVGNSQFPFGIVFADGFNTTTMGNTSAGDFVINSGVPHGGTQAQFTLQKGAAFNSYIVYANSTTGIREITNSVGGNLPFDNGVTIKGDIISSTVGNGLQLKGGSNAKIGTVVMNGNTPVVVANTSVTANSLIYLTTQITGGTVGAECVSAKVAGTSFSVVSTSSTDTSTVAYMIVEKN